MADGRLHVEAVAEVADDGASLGGRLDDHQSTGALGLACWHVLTSFHAGGSSPSVRSVSARRVRILLLPGCSLKASEAGGQVISGVRQPSGLVSSVCSPLKPEQAQGDEPAYLPIELVRQVTGVDVE
ncbi:hypothetical protein GCM10027079_12670 [Sediminivirga luteola]|uniref:Uncharacterized protein n=1 Tax=Sediminivirga luteola TaxID=1774748 RepID=A0A8J2TS63_9MICO|nr:hypothetical protein GCM10011333_00120 [Sediminivirga luteola]